MQDSAVVIDGFRIAWAGEAQSIPAEYQALLFTSVPVLLPGLWEYVCFSFHSISCLLVMVLRDGQDLISIEELH